MEAALFWDTTTRIRYLLPAILVIFSVLALAGKAFVLFPLQSKRSVCAVTVLLFMWCSAEYLSCMPHPLSYIPGIFGGMDNGYRFLADSSFD